MGAMKSTNKKKKTQLPESFSRKEAVMTIYIKALYIQYRNWVRQKTSF